nr:wax ester/triacylglycerol synthase family O-acyltransferase [Actinomycetota bacterium]
MATRLSGLDATFLYVETATNHMHVGSAIVLDPRDRPGGRLTRNDVAGYLQTRLHLDPSFRRRLAPVPLRVDHPLWIEDPDFDLDFHVRRAALPSPGGMAELAEFAGDVMSRRIDRSRPLWELHVVEGLEGGRVALVTKTHHAAIDGISGAELLAAILQLDPDEQPPPPRRP